MSGPVAGRSRVHRLFLDGVRADSIITVNRPSPGRSCNVTPLKPVTTCVRAALFGCLALLVPGLLPADTIPQSDEIWVRLTQTSGRKRLNLVLAPFTSHPGAPTDSLAMIESLHEVFEDDLRFSLHFTFQVPESGAVFDFDARPGSTDLKGWSTTGAEVLVCGHLGSDRNGPLLDIRLYDLEYERRIASKPYTLRANLRWLAHEMADDVIQLLTGEPGVSRTRIGFSRQAGAGVKELAWVDYDGKGLTQLTGTGNVSLYPDWSPDGGRMAYCTYGNNSLNIYAMDLGSRQRKTLSDREGLNTTPAWSPDGNTVATSLSFNGQSDIYLLDAEGRVKRRLTSSRGIDISPSWSPTGRELAFVSDRTGAPQVYVINADGTDLRRLTFEGPYNTSPSWSPRGDLVAFVQRQPGGANQVCVTNILGDTYVRLTSRGNNEDPSWSPDGLHIAFASTRGGAAELYTMDWNGANQRRVTRTGGAFSPTWSPVLE